MQTDQYLFLCSLPENIPKPLSTASAPSEDVTQFYSALSWLQEKQQHLLRMLQQNLIKSKIKIHSLFEHMLKQSGNTVDNGVFLAQIQAGEWP